MNRIKCPNCKLINLASAESCLRCGNVFTEADQPKAAVMPLRKAFPTDVDNSFKGFEADNYLGLRTYFWYRIYCLVMFLMYLAVTAFGIIAASFSDQAGTGNEQQEIFFTGVAYAIIGPVFAIVYLIALLLPKKSYNWIYGIIMIAIGMTSCCFLPAAVPLLIYWLKPETKAVFGRK